ncbi:MAG: 30S ribosomal protein S9 [Candidatus Eisenbacteria bacterium]|uniref:Small ribosomal subunit protein uS9 n=1 Tax=Eiseniibacteriota bacterium TaxID=2212470 RepID=A0A948RU07_UNCEI|nr:30S ribosomal protein S9 [Candidatus Eisenbacteria bacterium]MBU1950733.1 30S ribosomal protein S9 [Candidatus Eisenbacteria bacterium]MBU2690531.1 30S ribosomal protein S9 [Candidatus Eisenbacteria bacterium]
MVTKTAVVATTGRRKEAVARVRVIPGSGKIEVNGRPLAEYLQRGNLVLQARRPLTVTENEEKFDIQALVSGGGLRGQAGAISHGIARALLQIEPELRLALRKEGLLTRDPRAKERKKYGQPGARKRFQYSKR